MAVVSRRGFLAGAAATAAAATLGAPRVHAQKKGGTIRFIPHADLKVLDPVATTAYITRNHSYFIYDTLFGTDADLAIKPQMVDKYASSNKGLKWSFTLRDGLKFHDGAAVTAEDAVESLKRWWKKDPLGRLLAAHTAKIAPSDKKTFTLELSQPFGLVLDALGKPSSNVPFIMPARIAAASADEPIKETIGSGPFKFVRDEWQPGNQVVYVKKPDYVARQALLYIVDQPKYLKAAIGVEKYYKPCPALFTCGGPFESAAGAPGKPDLDRARQLVKESGYDGRPVVVLDPSDIALTHGAALVTRELLSQIGFNVDLQAMDWSSVVARRAKKEPPQQGGWNMLFTWWIASDVINPAVHAGISGAGDGAWFGWPESGRIEELKVQWARATDRAKQKQLAEEIQKVAYDEVMYVPFGQWVLPTAHRKAVSGVLQFPAPLFWNVSIA